MRVAAARTGIPSCFFRGPGLFLPLGDCGCRLLGIVCLPAQARAPYMEVEEGVAFAEHVCMGQEVCSSICTEESLDIYAPWEEFQVPKGGISIASLGSKPPFNLQDPEPSLAWISIEATRPSRIPKDTKRSRMTTRKTCVKTGVADPCVASLPDMSNNQKPAVRLGGKD